MTITQQSKTLFISYVESAPDWGGMPLVGGNVIISEQVDKGNLTHLKKLGLVETQVFEDDPRCTWLIFTRAGKMYAETLGFDTSDLSISIIK